MPALRERLFFFGRLLPSDIVVRRFDTAFSMLVEHFRELPDNISVRGMVGDVVDLIRVVGYVGEEDVLFGVYRPAIHTHVLVQPVAMRTDT